MNSFFWRAALNRKQRDYGFVFAQLGIITAPGEPQCPQWEAKKRFQNLTPLELPTLSPRMYCAWEPELRSVVGAWGLKAQGLPKQAAFLQISCDQMQIFELPGGKQLKHSPMT